MGQRKVLKQKIVVKSPEEVKKGDELVIIEKYKVINTMQLKEGSRYDWRIVTNKGHFQYCTEDLLVTADD